MMKLTRLLLVGLLSINLTGCFIAKIYDNNDHCQSHGDPNYKYPSFCGASGSGGYVTRGYYNNQPIYRTQYYRY